MSEGLVVVDKPAGWTSHDVVGRCRRLYGTKKVGHAGTLDPMATGLLILGVGPATRLLTYIVGLGKTYEATIRLGQTTTTDDTHKTGTETGDTGTNDTDAGDTDTSSDSGESTTRRTAGTTDSDTAADSDGSDNSESDGNGSGTGDSGSTD